MQGVRFYLLVTAAFSIVSGCGKGSPGSTAQVDPHQSSYGRMQASAKAMEGDWESDCTLDFAETGDYSKTFYSLHQGVLLKKLAIYKDSQCVNNQVWDRLWAGQYWLHNEELRQQYFSLTVVSYSALQTSLLNLGQKPDDRYCKTSTLFVTGTPVSFSPVGLCNEESEKVSKIDLRGDSSWGREMFVDDLKMWRSGSSLMGY